VSSDAQLNREPLRAADTEITISYQRISRTPHPGDDEGGDVRRYRDPRPAGTTAGATAAGAAAADAGIAPTALRSIEAAARRQQAAAHRLQAAYLIVLLLAPISRLVPIPGGRSGFDPAASALLLLLAVGLRLLLRGVAADADWVRARRESENLREAAWRRCVTGRPDPDDGQLSNEVGAADVAGRWQFYRQHRIDDQIAYFADRAERHRRSGRRWRLIRLVLTTGTIAVAGASLVVAVDAAVVGLVSALLATSEAWLQFRRSEVLAAGFTDARDDLLALRERQPADEAELARAVDDIERALERERWTWTAIMSVTVLTSPLPAAGNSTVDSRTA
jgi:hypothetical protein